MSLYAFYHVWADGAWHEPVTDFLQSVRATGLGDHLDGKYLGIVGTKENRALVRAAMPKWETAVTAETGYTQVTLDALRHFAEKTRHGRVIYGHSKGAMNNTAFNADWRRSMYRRVLEDWQDVVPLLDSYDAAGCHYITPELFPGMVDAEGRRFFGGEVWAARLDYIRTLPPLNYETRWHSEGWICENPRGRFYDLLPGWPAWELFK